MHVCLREFVHVGVHGEHTHVMMGVSVKVRRQSQMSVLVFYLFEIRSSCCFVLLLGLVFHCTIKVHKFIDPPVSASRLLAGALRLQPFLLCGQILCELWGFKVRSSHLPRKLAWLCPVYKAGDDENGIEVKWSLLGHSSPDPYYPTTLEI